MKSLKEYIEQNSKVSLLESKQEPNGFVILKPGFTNYEDEFSNLLKLNNWKVLDRKKKRLTANQAQNLYLPHKDKPFYQTLCDYMTSGECVCMTCRNTKSSDPIKDMNIFKDKIRAEWGKDEMKNAMHSSDSQENVIRESGICMK